MRLTRARIDAACSAGQRFQYPLFQREDQLDPAKLKQVGGRKPEYAPDDLLKSLPAKGLKNEKWIKAARADGISERTFFRLRPKLEKAGKILLSKATGRWTPISLKNEA